MNLKILKVKIGTFKCEESVQREILELETALLVVILFIILKKKKFSGFTLYLLYI